MPAQKLTCTELSQPVIGKTTKLMKTAIILFTVKMSEWY